MSQRKSNSMEEYVLSKRSEMHLPNKWPSYFSKTKGCLVWDLDGNQLVDTIIWVIQIF